MNEKKEGYFELGQRDRLTLPQFQMLCFTQSVRPF